MSFPNHASAAVQESYRGTGAPVRGESEQRTTRANYWTKVRGIPWYCLGWGDFARYHAATPSDAQTWSLGVAGKDDTSIGNSWRLMRLRTLRHVRSRADTEPLGRGVLRARR